MTLTHSLKEYRISIEESIAKINKLHKFSNKHHKTLIDSMNYSINAGGKRLRPILLLEANKLFGGAEAKAMPFACAIEFIHTYSLIHDDLPAMDDDDLRRGKPTNHKVFGEATAILAGDALLNLAYETMLDAIEDASGIKASRILADYAGSMGMIGGQSVDVLTEGQQIDFQTLEYIHVHKTTRLIQAALEMGATLGGGSVNEIEALGNFGFHLGMAFQIKDDILDLEGDQEVLGKPIGSDLSNGKNTFPKLKGLEASKTSLLNHTELALNSLDSIIGDTGFLKALTKYLLIRKA